MYAYINVVYIRVEYFSPFCLFIYDDRSIDGMQVMTAVGKCIYKGLDGQYIEYGIRTWFQTWALCVHRAMHGDFSNLKIKKDT